MSLPPIFLQVNGETDGPHTVDDILGMLDGTRDEDEFPGQRRIAKETLSSIEGMPAWCSVPETLVWARAQLLAPIQEEAMGIVRSMHAQEFDVRGAHTRLLEIFQQRGEVVDSDTVDALAYVLQVNANLLKNHTSYCAGEQGWNPDVLAFWQYFEFLPYHESRFDRDWRASWEQAGGRVFQGRMIARKDDPIWLALSDFGFPFPHFSFDDSMWIEEVNAIVAETLGVPHVADPIVLPQIKEFRLVGIV